MLHIHILWVFKKKEYHTINPLYSPTFLDLWIFTKNLYSWTIYWTYLIWNQHESCIQNKHIFFFKKEVISTVCVRSWNDRPSSPSRPLIASSPYRVLCFACFQESFLLLPSGVIRLHFPRFFCSLKYRVLMTVNPTLTRDLTEHFCFSEAWPCLLNERQLCCDWRRLESSGLL